MPSLLPTKGHGWPRYLVEYGPPLAGFRLDVQSQSFLLFIVLQLSLLGHSRSSPLRPCQARYGRERAIAGLPGLVSFLRAVLSCDGAVLSKQTSAEKVLLPPVSGGQPLSHEVADDCASAHQPASPRLSHRPTLPARPGVEWGILLPGRPALLRGPTPPWQPGAGLLCSGPSGPLQG